mmetsp:Transcript_5509/g.8438  ORF Transcript_5509/g.8438 Transcript_5509/m.8438 type:complete len:88 (+) Transcript_5509:822-1085(+)
MIVGLEQEMTMYVGVEIPVMLEDRDGCTWKSNVGRRSGAVGAVICLFSTDIACFVEKILHWDFRVIMFFIVFVGVHMSLMYVDWEGG